MRSFSSPSTPFPLPPSPPFPCPPLLRPLLSSGSPPLPSPTLPFRSPIHPPIQLMGLGERCELPEGVWAKPGCQTQFGASRVKSGLFRSAFMPLNYRYCSTVGVTPGQNPGGLSGLEDLGYWQQRRLSRTYLNLDRNYSDTSWWMYTVPSNVYMSIVVPDISIYLSKKSRLGQRAVWLAANGGRVAEKSRDRVFPPVFPSSDLVLRALLYPLSDPSSHNPTCYVVIGY